MNKEPIGIFDSGIGGVTVLKEIINILPNENILYYSDSLHNPYGSKTEEEIYIIVKNVVDYLKDHNCKIIVIACNTATAMAIDQLRKEYKDTCFIGTEPAYKMVHDYCHDKKTLILATPGTMKSNRFKELYSKYNNNLTSMYSCNGLADLIEQDKHEEIKEYLEEHLKNYKEENIEAVVLGCTHYPLIKREIESVLGKIIFFDSAKGVAKELSIQLEKRDLVCKEKETGKIEFIDSSQSKDKEIRFFSIIENKYI